MENNIDEIKINEVLRFYYQNKFYFLGLFIFFIILFYSIIYYNENKSKKTLIKISLNNASSDSLTLINYSLESFRSKIELEDKLPIEKFDMQVFSKNLIGLPGSINLSVLNSIILDYSKDNVRFELYSPIDENKNNLTYLLNVDLLSINSQEDFNTKLNNHIKKSLLDIYLRHKFLRNQISNFYLENIAVSKEFLIKQAKFEVAQIKNHLEFQYNLAKQLNIKYPQENPDFNVNLVGTTPVSDLLDLGSYYYTINYTIGYKLIETLIENLNTFDVKNSRKISILLLSESVLDSNEDLIIEKKINETIDTFNPDIYINNKYYLFKKNKYYMHILITAFILSFLVTYTFFIYNFYERRKK